MEDIFIQALANRAIVEADLLEKLPEEERSLVEERINEVKSEEESL